MTAPGDRVDPYIRIDLTSGDVWPFGTGAPGSGGLCFVDISGVNEDEVELAEPLIDEVIPLISHAEKVVFRWPEIGGPADDGFAARSDQLIRDWLTRLSSRRFVVTQSTNVGVLRFRLGQDPKLVMHDPARSWGVESVVRHARSAELSALLRTGEAIWSPTAYHYRLPSGEHSEYFVRLADAIRSPRDAFVLATWLLSRVKVPGTGFLIDSGSITSIVSELRALLSMHGWDSGPTGVLNAYPQTRIDVKRAVRSAVGPSGRILAILSVSASGRVRDLTIDALEETAPNAWSLDIIVDKPLARPGAGSRTAAVVSWLGLDDQAAASPVTGRCRLCRDPRRATVVEIDPRTFGALPITVDRLVRPNHVNSLRNRGFWELVAATQALAVEAKRHESAAAARPQRMPLAVRILLDNILADEPALLSALRSRLESLQSMPGKPDEGLTALLERLRNVRVVVVSDYDVRDKEPGDRTPMLRRVLATLGVLVGTVLIANNGSLDRRGEELLADLGVEDDLLVFSWGSVTGWSLSRLRAAVERVAPGRARHIVGLSLHSRPPAREDWTATVASFQSTAVGSVWQTYLPIESPLQEEHSLLDEFCAQPVFSRLDEGPRAFILSRTEIVAPADHLLEWDDRLRAADLGDARDPRAILWPLPEPSIPLVLGDGIFGRDLDIVTIYAAAGSAVHQARIDSQERVRLPWIRFDMPSLVLAGYRAVELAAVLRWIRPFESWWGASAADAELAMQSILVGYRHDPHLPILMCELLLGGALGKVPASGMAVLIPAAKASASTPTIESAVTAGTLLYEWADVHVATPTKIALSTPGA